MPRKNEWISRYSVSRRAIDRALLAECERAPWVGLKSSFNQRSIPRPFCVGADYQSIRPPALLTGRIKVRTK